LPYISFLYLVESFPDLLSLHVASLSIPLSHYVRQD